jgi:hypothetical protein
MCGMTRRIPTLLAVIALAGLSACGGDDGRSGGDATATDLRDAALDYARCMREQGVDMPDPKTDENGVILADGTQPREVDTARFADADKSCRKHLEAVEPPKLSEREQEDFRRGALVHAECMRENGVDFPDPSFSEDGGAMVNIGPGSGIDPDSPAFKRAQEACEDLMRRPGAGS